jgi:hypothetical protein
MALFRTRLGASIAALAAFSLSAGPAFAGHGWGDWGRHRHRDRVDVGDVLTGILIVGGIAAIASAASSSDRNRDRRRDDRRDDRRDSDDYQRDADYPANRAPDSQYAPAPSWNEGGLASAVDRCTNEFSGTGGRSEVDAVSRAGDGWRVQGRTGEGQAYSCTVDGNGRIRNISVEGENG